MKAKTKRAPKADELRLDAGAFDRIMGHALQVTPEKTAKAAGPRKTKSRRGLRKS